MSYKKMYLGKKRGCCFCSFWSFSIINFESILKPFTTLMMGKKNTGKMAMGITAPLI